MISVLYVDDEQSLLEIAQLFLEETGDFQIAISTSAKKSLESSQILSYDAIISDYQMPGLDGIAFLKAVRQRSTDIPFILFTGRGREEIVIEAINNGADFYLQKGGDPEAQFAELAHKIRQAVARRQAERSLQMAYEQLTASEEELRGQYEELAQSEQRIRESEARFRELAELLPQIVFEMDPDFRATYANRYALTALGLTPEDLRQGVTGLSFIDPAGHQRARMALERLTRGDPDENAEYTAVRRDGSRFPALIYAAPIYRAESLAGFRGVMIDISRQKKTEDALRESELFLKETQRIARLGGWKANPHTDYLEWTEGIYDIIEAPRTYRPGLREGMKYFVPEDVTVIREKIATCLATGEPFTTEVRIITETGKELWTEVRCLAPVLEGTCSYVVGTFQDITERRRVQDELRGTFEQLTASDEELRAQYDELAQSENRIRESEKKFRAVFEKTHDALVLLTEDGFIDCNQQALALFGYPSREEFLSLHAADLSPPFQPDGQDTRSAATAHMGTVFEKGMDQVEWLHKRKDGSTFPADLLFSAFELDGKQIYQVSVRDITERKKTEESLRRLSQQDREALHVARMGHFEFDTTSQEFLSSDPFYEMIGLTADEAGEYRISLAEFIRRFIPPEGSPVLEETIRKAMETPDPGFETQFETPLIRPDGTRMWVTTWFRIGKDPAGKSVRFYGVTQDITDRKRAQDELRAAFEQVAAAENELRGQYDELARSERKIRESEEKFRAVFEKTHDALILLTEDGFIDCNQQAVTLFGYSSRDEFLHLHSTDLSPPFQPDGQNSLSTAIAHMGTVIEKGMARFEWLHKRKDGSTFPADLLFSAFELEGKPVYQVSIRDITERKRAEGALQQANFVVENSPVVLFRWKAADGWPVVYVSQNIIRFGYTPEELVSGNVLYSSIMYPDDLDRVTEEVRNYSADGREQFQQEYRIVTKDGDVRWIDDRTTIERDRDGQITHYQGIIIDITGRRKTGDTLRAAHGQQTASGEELPAACGQLAAASKELQTRYDALKEGQQLLRQSEAKFRAVISQSYEFIGLLRTDGTLIEANRSSLAFAGISEAEVLDRPFWETPWWKHSVPMQEKLRDAVQKAALGETVRFEATHTASDGHVATFDFSIKPVVDETGNIQYLIPEGRDITDRKLAEEELKRSENLYRTVFDNTGAATIIVAPDMTIQRANAGWEKLTGVSREEWKNKPIGNVFFDRNEFERLKQFLQSRQDDPVGASRVYECCVIDASHEVHHCYVHADCIPGTKNTVASFVDITGLKQAEATLRKSEQDYRSIVENMQDAFFRTDMQGNLLMISPSFAKEFGYAGEENVLRKNIFDYFPVSPRDRERVLRKLENSGELKESRIAIERREGSPVVVSATGHVVHDETGKPAGVEGILHDITDIVRAKEELRKSREKLRSVLDNLPDLVLVHRDGIILYVNPTMVETTGMLPDEVLNRPLLDYILPEYHARAADVIRTSIGTGQDEPYEIEIVFPVTGRRTVLIRGSVIDFDGSPAVLNVLTDITERRKAVEALRESEEKFRSYVENANDIIYSLAPDGIITYVSPKWRELLGHDTREIVGTSFEEYIHPDDLPVCREFARQVFVSGEKRSGLEYRVRHKNGTWQWHMSTTSPIRDDGGNVVSFMGICHDITKRKRAEAALRESEEKFRSFVETSPNILWETDLQGKFRYISPTVTAILGYTPEEIMSKTTTDLITDEGKSVSRQAVAQIKSSGSIPSSIEVPARHRDGRQIIVEIRPSRKGTGGVTNGFRGVAVDITERKKAEDTLRLANRQLSLLTGITRHDILNKITVILGYLKIAEKKYSDPALAEYLGKIDSATAAIKSQIEFTRVYEDLGASEPQWLELADVMSRLQVPSTITLHADVTGIKVFADPMLERVFFNLLDNAIRHGEHVTEIRVSSHPSGENLVVVWEDNGVGIAADEKERIFERGFGKNTGLGMFLVREILSLTGITIRETGEQGTGARFEILVPKGAFRVTGV